MDLFPIITVVSSQPARVVNEYKNMIRTFCLRQSVFQPRKLSMTHFLGRWFTGGFLPSFRIAFVGVEHDEPAVLMFKGIPERREMLFVVGFVFAWRFFFCHPIDVMIPGHRKPGHQQTIHDPAILPHLNEPFHLFPGSLHQISHGHHQIRFQQVDLIHRLSQHLNTFSRATGSVSENGKGESRVLRGKREFTSVATGMETLGVRRLRMRENQSRALSMD